MDTVTFRKVDVDGIKVFYREAGPVTFRVTTANDATG
jgi:hypothetical protein